jgi:hypothetical protein
VTIVPPQYLYLFGHTTLLLYFLRWLSSRASEFEDSCGSRVGADPFAGALRRRGFDGGDGEALADRQSELGGDLRRHLLIEDSEEGAANHPGGEQLVRDIAGEVDGNREAEACRDGRADDGGVDADDLAGGVEQGSSGVTGVDGGVRLDQFVELGAEGAVEAGDDTASDRPFESEGIADGEGELSDLEKVGIGEWSGGKIGRRDPEDGDIDPLIPTEDSPGIFRPVGEADADLSRVAETWLLVRMTPSSRMTTPEPEPAPVWMPTTAGVA